MNNRKLWAILIPGPDEVFAMESEEKAKEEAAKHNAFVDSEKLAEKSGVSTDALYAQVIEWPHDNQTHSDCLESGDSESMYD